MLRTTLALTGLVALACASAPRAGLAEDVVARGGPLRVEDMPAASVRADVDGLVVWAMTELPGSSRMQAAHAAIDAITRAELITYLEVRVASAMADLESEEVQRIKLVTGEAVRARVTGSAPIEHGWVKLRRDTGIVLRLVARMKVPRELLASVVTEEASLGDLSERVLEALFEARP